MKVSFTGERLASHLRMWVLPMFLVVVYALQQQFPAMHRHCALWSDHPHWWQFFTCNFLSNDLYHLAVTAGGLWLVYSQFAPQVRFPMLALAFCFFATLATWMFHEWWMPKHASLIGSSGGSYALLGFFSWFLRRARFCFYKCKRLRFPILPVLVVFIIGEYLYARWRMPGLAWQVHAIGFCLGLGVAIAAHAAYVFFGKLFKGEDAQAREPVFLRSLRSFVVDPRYSGAVDQNPCGKASSE